MTHWYECEDDAEFLRGVQEFLDQEVELSEEAIPRLLELAWQSVGRREPAPEAG